MLDGLVDVLNKVIINIEHHLRNHLLVKGVFYWRFRGIFRLKCLALNDSVLAKEFNPVLEVWHDSV